MNPPFSSRIGSHPLSAFPPPHFHWQIWGWTLCGAAAVGECPNKKGPWSLCHVLPGQMPLSVHCLDWQHSACLWSWSLGKVDSHIRLTSWIWDWWHAFLTDFWSVLSQPPLYENYFLFPFLPIFAFSWLPVLSFQDPWSEPNVARNKLTSNSVSLGILVIQSQNVFVMIWTITPTRHCAVWLAHDKCWTNISHF